MVKKPKKKKTEIVRPYVLPSTIVLVIILKKNLKSVQSMPAVITTYPPTVGFCVSVNEGSFGSV